MTRRLVGFTLAAVAVLLTTAPPAHASCLPSDARLKLAGADAGIVGTVVEDREAEVVVRVERVVKGDVPQGDLLVRDPGEGTSGGLYARPGERLGLALHGDRASGWSTSGCARIAPGAIVRAAASAPPCEVGGRIVEPARVAYVLGCIGPTSELRGRRLRSSLCIDFADLLFGGTTGCATHRVRGRAPARVEAVARINGRATLIGPAKPAVRGVRLHYRGYSGKRSARDAGFLAVSDPGLLRRLRVARPFGQFVATVPQWATPVRLIALDARRRSLGRVVIPAGMRRLASRGGART